MESTATPWARLLEHLPACSALPAQTMIVAAEVAIGTRPASPKER